jgi:hypothetical protein
MANRSSLQGCRSIASECSFLSGIAVQRSFASLGPNRVARLWLAMAVATLWMITLGSDLEVGPSEDCPTLPDLRAILGLRGERRPRRTRLFRLGWLWLLV